VQDRYILTAPVPNKAANTFNPAIEEFIAEPPPMILRCTLTVDNGKDMARFNDLREATGLQVYFADPYASWQCGVNESGNDLLRQYFPKGCNFRKMSITKIHEAIHRLSHRSGKCLGYLTPHEVFL